MISKKAVLLWVGVIIVVHVLSQVTVLAWGTEGHHIVARIASNHLSAKARAGIQKLLGSESLESVSSWADSIRGIRPATEPWHFVDIPLSKTTYDSTSQCVNGNCVIAQLAHFRSVLADAHASKDDKVEALKFVVHFVGDLHQPLHCADNNDRGGNNVKVVFFSDSSNLHSVWDTGILLRSMAIAKKNKNQYADMLNTRLTTSALKKFQSGNSTAWALEGHRIAQKTGYGKKPKDNKLGMPYYQDCVNQINEQLTKGGARLAMILNAIFQ